MGRSSGVKRGNHVQKMEMGHQTLHFHRPAVLHSMRFYNKAKTPKTALMRSQGLSFRGG